MAFIQRLDLALAGLPEFPIEIHTAHDQTWSIYEEFKAGVKEPVRTESPSAIRGLGSRYP